MEKIRCQEIYCYFLLTALAWNAFSTMSDARQAPWVRIVSEVPQAKGGSTCTESVLRRIESTHPGYGTVHSLYLRPKCVIDSRLAIRTSITFLVLLRALLHTEVLFF